MPEKKKRAPAPKVRVTYSELSTWKNCRQRHHYAYVERLTPIRKQVAFTLGTAVHHALEAFHAHPTDDAGRLEKALTFLDKSFQEQAEEQAKRIGGDLWEEDVEASKKLRDQGADMLKAYAGFDRSHHVKIDRVKPEIQFEVPMRTPKGRKSTKFILTGRVDGIAAIAEAEGFYLLEHKTAAKVGHRYTARLPLDDQISVYLWALRELYGVDDKGRHHVRGIVYNVLGKSPPKKPKILSSGKLSTDARQNTSYELVMDAIEETKSSWGNRANMYIQYLDMLSTRENDAFYRDVVMLTTKDMKRMERELYETAIEMNNKRTYVTRNPKSCETYSCPFRAICIDDTPEGREAFYIRDAVHAELEPTEEGAE